MDGVSVVIPARNEPYLQKTIDSLLTAAKGEIEVIAVLDGYWPDPPIRDNSRVKLIHFSESRGMRSAINAAARLAKGKYLMKCDAHCLFGEGFDVELSKICRHNWTIVPTRYKLNVEDWTKGEEVCNFEYIDLPSFKGRKWPKYAERLDDRPLVNLMTFQGSCWFMRLERFRYLEGLDEVNYGMMGREAQEVSLKTWLSGGRQLLNRSVWYAHWSKPSSNYPGRKEAKEKSIAYSKELWLKNKWKLQCRTLAWLLEKFTPVPTSHESLIEGGPLETNSLKASSLPTKDYIQEKYKLEGKEFPIKIEGMNRVGMYELFAELGYKIGCEVGVWSGPNARNMFKVIPDLELYLVDQYCDYPAARKQRGSDKFRQAKEKAHQRMAGQKATFLEMFSEDAVKEVPDGSLDFVYIDGNHNYDFVMLDIILWSRKVREGGMVSGHDYYTDDRHGMGVESAVNDYARFHRIPFYITDKGAETKGKMRAPSWFWIKEKE